MSGENFTAFIFARGGSKGVPNKNIREVSGQPLISYSIQSASKSSFIGNVIVSTDSDDIASVAREYGAEVLERPADLAADDTPEIEAWRHAVSSKSHLFEKDAPFISLPSTSPLRSAEDIDAGIKRFQKGDCDVVFGISPASHSPYLSMAHVNNDDLLELVIADSDAFQRQGLPEVYDITGCVYIADPEYVMSCESIIKGRTAYVMIPPERALDIDSEFDLYLADLILKHPFQKGGNDGS